MKSKTARKRDRARRHRKKRRDVTRTSWSKVKGETRIQAFLRQASPTALRDYERLRVRGWDSIEAAVEAWETDKETTN